MRTTVAALLAMAALAGAASAQSPTQPLAPPNTPSGARPGNEIGTGMSMPMSDRASNIGPSDSGSTIAPNLPSPALGENALPSAFLRAAQGALAAGRTGEAQQAMEMAQTRMLDRSVPMLQTNTPSANPAVKAVSQALQALAMGDRAAALQHIQVALPTADSVN